MDSGRSAIRRAQKSSWLAFSGPARSPPRICAKSGKGLPRGRGGGNELPEKSSESEEVHPLSVSGHLMRFGCPSDLSR